MRSLRFCVFVFLCIAASGAQVVPVPPNTPFTRPSVVSQVDPKYSEEARRAKVQSSVNLSIVVNQAGAAEDIQVVRGAGFGLDELAIEAVKKWQFKAGTVRGAAANFRAQVEVNFRLVPGHNEPPVPPAISRLNFILPQGATRPQLVTGAIPYDPNLPDERSVSLHLRVDTAGAPQDITVINSNDKNWEKLALQVVKGWHFSPATVKGAAVAVDGVLEVTWTVAATRH